MITLDATYATGTALAAVLNAAGSETVNVSGTVTVTTGNVTVTNASLVLVGSGRLVSRLSLSAGNLELNGFASISALWLDAPVRFPAASTAAGVIDDVKVNSLTFSEQQYAYTYTPGTNIPLARIEITDSQVTGLTQGCFDSCTFRRCDFVGRVWWVGSYNSFYNCTFPAIAHATRVWNSPSSYNYARSSRGNRFDGCTFAAGTGTQELFGTDCLADGDTVESAILSVTAVGAGTLTLQVQSDYAEWLDTTIAGKTLVLMTGAGAGRYFPIVSSTGSSSVAGSSAVYTLELIAHDLTGVLVGDKGIVANMFVENTVIGCTFTTVASAATGISLYGYCYGNIVRENTLTGFNYGIADYSFNIYTNKIYTGTPQHAALRWRYFPNGGNKVYDNTLTTCTVPIHSRAVAVSQYLVDTEEYYLDLPNVAPLNPVHRFCEYVRNTWNSGTSEVIDSVEVGWLDNTEAASTLGSYGWDTGPTPGASLTTFADPFTPTSFYVLELVADDRWSQNGTALSVTAPREVRTSVQATVVSSLGGTLKFIGTHAGRFTCSLDDVTYAATQTLPVGATTVYLGVTPEAGDTILTAQVAVPL